MARAIKLYRDKKSSAGDLVAYALDRDADNSIRQALTIYLEEHPGTDRTMLSDVVRELNPAIASEYDDLDEDALYPLYEQLRTKKDLHRLGEMSEYDNEGNLDSGEDDAKLTKMKRGYSVYSVPDIDNITDNDRYDLLQHIKGHLKSGAVPYEVYAEGDTEGLEGYSQARDNQFLPGLYERQYTSVTPNKKIDDIDDYVNNLRSFSNILAGIQRK